MVLLEIVISRKNDSQIERQLLSFKQTDVVVKKAYISDLSIAISICHLGIGDSRRDCPDMAPMNGVWEKTQNASQKRCPEMGLSGLARLIRLTE